MSRDDIIRMAREAGFNHPRLETETDYCRLERLVALARADEHASMMQLFTDPENQPTQHGTVTVEYMREQIAAEREACAKACDGISEDQWALYKGRPPYTGQELERASEYTQGKSDGAEVCAAAIRARGQA